MTVRVNKPAINVREELADLRKPTGIAGEAMLRAETPQEQFNLIGAGRRNLIINGDFQVWQRGTSFSSGFTADRWYTAAGTVTKDGFAYKHIATNTDPYLLYQVEDIDNRLAGKDAVFSFYLKTSSGANRLQYLTFCGTSYLHDVMYQLPSEIGGYTRWACPVKITDANTGYIRIVVELEAVNGNISYLRQVQLELGKVATPFEHRSYGEELNLAQRYFCKLDFPQTTPIGPVHKQTTNTIRTLINLPVPMRAEPSINSTGQPSFFLYWSVGGTDSSATNTSGTAFSVVGNSLDNARVTLSATVSGVESLMGSFFGYSGDLNFDAEL